MSELEKVKNNIVFQLRGLCAHCATQNPRLHHCPPQELTARVQAIKGVPLIVNNEFKGVLFGR